MGCTHLQPRAVTQPQGAAKIPKTIRFHTDLVAIHRYRKTAEGDGLLDAACVGGVSGQGALMLDDGGARRVERGVCPHRDPATTRGAERVNHPVGCLDEELGGTEGEGVIDAEVPRPVPTLLPCVSTVR